MNRWKRLVYRQDGELINPLAHIFFFQTLVYGVSFALLPELTHANESHLYQSVHLDIHNEIISLWGWFLILVTLGNTLMLMYRKFGGTVAMSGFLAWVYASMVYLLDHFWIGFLAMGLPNMVFWVWYYRRVMNYHRHPPRARSSVVE